MPRLKGTHRSESTSTVEPFHERLKAVLTCPECDHESPVDGEWDHRYQRGGVSVNCPTCDAHLTTREA